MRIGLAWMGLSLLLVACGGATTTDLQSDAAPTGNGNDAGGNDKDATTGKDAGPPVKDASPVDDGPTMIDVDVPDVPVGPPDSFITCGSSKCSAQNEFCCRTGAFNNYAYACLANGDKGKCAGQGDVPLTCSNGDNCASQGNAGWQCCGQVVQSQQCTVATETVCKQTCDTQVGEFQVGCDPQQANSCGPNAYCKVSTCSLYGYPICVGN